MWIIDFLAETTTHLLLVLGIVTTIIALLSSFILPISKYKPFILTLGIVLSLIGVYQEGKLANDKEWKAKVDSLQSKIDEAEANSKKINTKVVTKVVTQEKIIKQKGDTVIEYIDREVVKYDKQCPIPKSVITAHDAAARNKAIDEVLTPNSLIKTDEHNEAATAPKK